MIYVASRVHHAALWATKKTEGFPIGSTWIAEAETDTKDLNKLWVRIIEEIKQSDVLVLYVEQIDLPLKGAFIETGIALAIGLPIRVALLDVSLESRSLRPIGSWLHHPNVRVHYGPDCLDKALRAARCYCD